MKRKSSSSSGRQRRKYKRRRFGKSKTTRRYGQSKLQRLRRKTKTSQSKKNSRYALRIAKVVFPNVQSKWMTLCNNNRTVLGTDPFANGNFHKTAHMVNHPWQCFYNNRQNTTSATWYPQCTRIAFNDTNCKEPARGDKTGYGDIHHRGEDLLGATPNDRFALFRGFERLLKFYESGIITKGKCTWNIRLRSRQGYVESGTQAAGLTTNGGYVIPPSTVHIVTMICNVEDYATFFPKGVNSMTKTFEDFNKLGPCKVFRVNVPNNGTEKVITFSKKWDVKNIYGPVAGTAIASGLKPDPVSTLPSNVGTGAIGYLGGVIYPIDEYGFRSMNADEQSASDHTSIFAATLFRPIIGVCFVWREINQFTPSNEIAVDVEYVNTAKITFMNRRSLDPVQHDVRQLTVPEVNHFFSNKTIGMDQNGVMPGDKLNNQWGVLNTIDSGET